MAIKFTKEELKAFNDSVNRQKTVDKGGKVKCKKSGCKGHTKIWESCT